MVAGRAQPHGVGSRPVDERIKGQIPVGGTRTEWGRDKHVRCCGGKVVCPGAPDARNERQRRHGRPRRTGCKEQTVFVWKRALSVRRKSFFCSCSHDLIHSFRLLIGLGLIRSQYLSLNPKPFTQ